MSSKGAPVDSSTRHFAPCPTKLDDCSSLQKQDPYQKGELHKNQLKFGFSSQAFSQANPGARREIPGVRCKVPNTRWGVVRLFDPFEESDLRRKREYLDGKKNEDQVQMLLAVQICY